MANCTIPIIDGSTLYNKDRQLLTISRNSTGVPTSPVLLHNSYSLDEVESRAKVVLQKHADARTKKDNEVLFTYLRSIRSHLRLNDADIHKMLHLMRYEQHGGDEVLYGQDELITCWYILISGIVFINGSMFLPIACFGQRTGCTHRVSDCLILEPTEMIVVDYPDCGLMKPTLQRSLSQSSSTSRSSGRHRHQSHHQQPQHHHHKPPASSATMLYSGNVGSDGYDGHSVGNNSTHHIILNQQRNRHYQQPKHHHQHIQLQQHDLYCNNTTSSSSANTTSANGRVHDGRSMADNTGKFFSDPDYKQLTSDYSPRMMPRVPPIYPSYHQFHHNQQYTTSTANIVPTSHDHHNQHHHHHGVSSAVPGGGGDSVVSDIDDQITTMTRDDTLKRHSRASDTSSAYSGSDKMQTSSVGGGDDEGCYSVGGGDQASGCGSSIGGPGPPVGHPQTAAGTTSKAVDADGDGNSSSAGYTTSDHMVDISNMKDSLPPDSDDEEGYDEPINSLIVRDTVRECLEKDPADRTDEDIEVLLEFLQHLPAFANMTLAIRRALCAVMVFAVVETEGTVVMNDGEELDSWSVILNGHVEIQRPDGSYEHLHMGDSFGITPTMEKLHHKGVMRTKANDCQFVCIAQSDYYRILHQGEENTQRHEEQGQVVLVTEHRVLDAGNRKGHIVIRGTPERLMQHLIEEHSQVDPTYVEDFLLTYRTFLASPHNVASKLLQWFDDPKTRDKVTRVVLLWVNNHFNDFETQSDLSEFLEEFETLLDRESMGGQLRLLNIACATKAQPRTVVLTRATREEILNFTVLGGIERGCGIFISKVDKASKAHEAGLKRGDQILEVNNQNFEQIAHHRALEVLRRTTHLSITVKSNLLSFKEMLLTPDNMSPSRSSKQLVSRHSDPTRPPRLTVPGVAAPTLLPNLSPLGGQRQGGKKGDKKSSGGQPTGHKARLRRMLMRLSGPKTSVDSSQMSSLDDTSSTSSSGLHRKGSGSSNGSLPSMPLHLSASNPDLSSNVIHTQHSVDEGRNEYPEHVLKIYKSDQTCKYFLVHRETTAREVVMLAVSEFALTDASSKYSLYEVSVGAEGFVKQKRLPEQMINLPDSIGLNSRYYLKHNASTEPLVPDDTAADLLRDTHTSFLQLQSTEIAAQLTLQDFRLFRDIQPTEYIDDLFELESKYGRDHLQKFTDLVNKEMFWVVTEVCNESNIVRRMKIIKQFIKIARQCKECKNFNSMFAIISGLGHGSVSRLRNTWERLPNKYAKLFEDLQDLMDPSMNMSKYRNMISSDMVQPPMIPFFPVIKKDLTFIHLGNDSKVDKLVNFEKLRMIAKEIRNTCNMAAAQYDLANMLLGGGTSQSILSAFSSSHHSSLATLRRKRRNSIVPNAKRMFEEAQMVRRVKQYLNKLTVIDDENKLNTMSLQCEPQPLSASRKRDPSPNPARHRLASDKPVVDLAPKFGVENPEGVMKMLMLSDESKLRSHTKTPTPHSGPLVQQTTGVGGSAVLQRSHSPAPGMLSGMNSSPKHSSAAARAAAPSVHHQTRHLSPESSSVVSMSNMDLRKTNSVGSSESASPTNSIGSSAGAAYQQQLETDSGHNSISSCYDSHSTTSSTHDNSSSITATHHHGNSHGNYYHHHPHGTSSPQTAHRHSHAANTNGGNTSAANRPRMPPPYETVMQHSTAYNYFMDHQCANINVLHSRQHHSHPNRKSHGVSGSGGGAGVTDRPKLPNYQQAAQMARQIAREKEMAKLSAAGGGSGGGAVALQGGEHDISCSCASCEAQVSAV